MKQKKVLSAVLEGRCPRCRQGKVFQYPLLKVTRFNSTHKNCPVCDLQFEREPGFWYGAMYVSYGFSVGLFLVTSILLYTVFGDPPLTIYIAVIVALAAITYPANFRYSRLVYLYLVSGTKYDDQYTTEQ